MEGALELLKLKLGITTNKRDNILENILESIYIELREVQGINLDLKNKSHLFFLIDYAEFRYKGGGKIPRHLQWRMNNFYIKVGGKND